MKQFVRRLVCRCLAALLGAASLSLAAAAEPAKHPAMKAVDYEARYAEAFSLDGAERDGHTVIHHAGFLRRLSRWQNGTRSEYTRLGAGWRISFITGDDGMPRSLYIQGPSYWASRELKIGVQGDAEKFDLGRCRWSKVTEQRLDMVIPTLAYFQCFAADGVIVATRFRAQEDIDGRSTILARKIDRRPVDIAEVTPPPSLLDPATWIKLPKTYGQINNSRPDYVVTYRREGETVERRRHFPWLYEKTSNAARLVQAKAWSEVAPVGWLMQAGTDGRPGRFEISQWKSGDQEAVLLDHQFDLVTKPTRAEGREIILGERCKWYDMAPEVYDAGQRQCLTSDMVPLAIEHSSEGAGSTTMTAIKVARKSVRLEEMKPPKEWFDLSFWGLEK